MSRRVSGIRNIDWMTFSLYLALIFIGVMMVHAANYSDTENTSVLDLNTIVGKQIMWIGVSLTLLTITILIDRKFWTTFGYLIYAFTMLLLILVLFLGVEIKGATSWFRVFGSTLQPSEFAKFGTCLALSSYLSTYSTSLKDIRSGIIAIGILALPMFLIMLQPDAGSALVFLSFFILLFREGLSANLYVFGISIASILIAGFVFEAQQIIYILFCIASLILIFNLKFKKTYWFLGFLALVAATYYSWIEGYFLYGFITTAIFTLGLILFHYQKGDRRLVMPIGALISFGSVIAFFANYFFQNVLKPHQQDRINVWLQPHLCDPHGSYYNVIQSKLTIGSGGLNGKGFLNGTMTKLNYVPEQSTDFIFCTIGEEQGFIGTFAIIALFLLLLIRIITIAERQRNDFGRHYAYGVAGIIFIHFFINIGMTMGLAPVVGIPLPFISYGGSSLMGFTLMIAVLLKLDSSRYIV